MLDCNSFTKPGHKSQTYISTREEKGSLFLKHDLAIEIEQVFSTQNGDGHGKRTIFQSETINIMPERDIKFHLCLCLPPQALP